MPPIDPNDIIAGLEALKARLDPEGPDRVRKAMKGVFDVVIDQINIWKDPDEPLNQKESAQDFVRSTYRERWLDLYNQKRFKRFPGDPDFIEDQDAFINEFKVLLDQFLALKLPVPMNVDQGGGRRKLKRTRKTKKSKRTKKLRRSNRR